MDSELRQTASELRLIAEERLKEIAEAGENISVKQSAGQLREDVEILAQRLELLAERISEVEDRNRASSKDLTQAKEIVDKQQKRQDVRLDTLEED